MSKIKSKTTLEVEMEAIRIAIGIEAQEITKKVYEFNLLTNKFCEYQLRSANIEKLTRRLEYWFELEFSEFIKELNKAIKKSGGLKLTKTDEMEWLELFGTQKAEAQTLKAEIVKADKEIDLMVYELYNLAEEEIQIVENN